LSIRQNRRDYRNRCCFLLPSVYRNIREIDGGCFVAPSDSKRSRMQRKE